MDYQHQFVGGDFFYVSSSPQDDSYNCFNKLRLRWKILRGHRDTDLNWSLSSEALFFFGHLLSRFDHLETPVLRQGTPSVVSSTIDLSDVLEALLKRCSCTFWKRCSSSSTRVDLLWDDSVSSSSTTVSSFDLTNLRFERIL